MVDRDALSDAVRVAVRFKDRLDAQGRLQKHAPSVVRMAWALTGIQSQARWGWTAIDPSGFVEHSLPFSYPHIEQEGVERSIDPRLVISGTYRTYEADASLIDWSDGAASANMPGDNAVPRYVQIGQLPLYVAIEGKNRVGLFKQQGQSSMKAVVSDTAYPAADELELVRLQPFRQFALRYQDQTRVLPFSEPIVPLLKAYGVRISRDKVSLVAPLAERRTRLEVCSRQMIR